MDENPFKGIPLFGDLARMLQGQGPVSWDAARQLAWAIATDNGPETNVDPLVRVRWAELGRIADLHVQDISGLSTTNAGREAEIVAVTPGQWALQALQDYRPLFETLAGALQGGVAAPPQLSEDVPEEAEALLGGLMQMLSPVMLGMSAGSMVGHLARRCLGQYDLPVPRLPSHEIQVVDATVSSFGSDWSLVLDDLRLWVCLQELAMHAVVSVPHVRDELERRIRAYVSGFRPNPHALEERLGSLEMTDAANPMGDARD
jgi:uncharacterized protein (DUF2342 family)